MRPTREQCGQHYRSPIWPYSGWGLPCHGMLPPARCALTAPFHPYRSPEMNQEDLGGIFSVALSIGSRRPGVTWHPALRSPDFPPLGHGERGREAAVWPTPVTIIPVYQSLPVSFWKPQACAGLTLNPMDIRRRLDSLRVTSCHVSCVKNTNFPAQWTRHISGIREFHEYPRGHYFPGFLSGVKRSLNLSRAVSTLPPEV